MTRAWLLALALLAGSCATERSIQRAANGIAATSAGITAVVARFVPPPASVENLTSKQQELVNLVPVIVLNAFAIWHAIDEYWASTHTPADMGVSDAGVP